MVLDVLRITAPFIVGYLVGGIPWSLIIGKRFYRIDLRERGSGNLGATNVFRELGARAAIAVLLLDVGKGALAVSLAMLVCPSSVTGHARDWVLIGVAITAVLGHTFSPYIRFRGGKGVATAAGAIAVVMPYTWPILFLTFAAIIAGTRIVSLGSIVIAIEFPLVTWLLYPERPAFTVFSVATALLVVVNHRSNIVRILRGEERKLSFRGRGEAVSTDEEE